LETSISAFIERLSGGFRVYQFLFLYIHICTLTSAKQFSCRIAVLAFSRWLLFISLIWQHNLA